MNDDHVISLIQQLFEQQSGQMQRNHDELVAALNRHSDDDSASFGAVNERIDTVKKDVDEVADDVRDHKKWVSGAKYLSLAAIGAAISSWVGRWFMK